MSPNAEICKTITTGRYRYVEKREYLCILCGPWSHTTQIQKPIKGNIDSTPASLERYRMCPQVGIMTNHT